MPNETPAGNRPGEIQRYVLKNGAILLVKEDPTTPVASLNIWVEAGSIDERPDERGMAHLIEHMIFKGTKNRGVGEISRQIEAAGGYLNAFTSFEHTCFYVVLPADQIEKALDIEFDAYLHSTFDKVELEKEKEVVFEEMRMRRDDPWSWSWEILFDSLFQKNPYHWPVIGDMKILGGVPQGKLLRYYKKHYVPSNTVIAVVGKVSGEKVFSWMNRRFGGYRAPRAPKRNFRMDSEPKGLRLRVVEGEVQQLYLSLGFPTVPLGHSETAALDILESALGDGASSRLNLTLREKKQYADEIGSDHFTGKFGGAFIFQALTDGKRARKCLGEFMAQVRRVCMEGVSEDELAKVKNKITASKVFEKQNVDGQAKTLGFWELQGGYGKDEEYLAALNRVTSQEVQAAAEKYLAPQRATLVLYHPKGQKLNRTSTHWEKTLRDGWRTYEKPKRSFSKESGLQKFHLKNGSTLWVKERGGLPLNSLGLFVKGGFSEEENGLYGITSLLTKCVLKGTKSKSHESFSTEAESLAAHLDPMMDKDYWGLVLDVLKPNFEKAFDLMSETFWEPSFDPSEVEKEKKLQMASIARLKDDPAEYALLRSDVATFEGTPYAHMPMGTLETVGKIRRSDLQAWHNRFLNPRRMTWMAVGDYDGRELKNWLDSKLPGGSKSKTSPKSSFRQPPLKPKNLSLASDNQQAHLVLGLAAPVFFGEDYFSFRVLNTLLNGMGGRLFVELREKKSLAYSVFAAHDAGTQAGIYQVYIGCAPSKISEAKDELLKVLRSFVEGKITEEEIQRAKTYLIGLFKLGLQSNRSQVQSYARYEVAGPGAQWVEKFPDRIRRVGLEDVRKAAKKYLASENKTWVTLAPNPEKSLNVRPV